jgi:aspartate aminotransferase-like enzyme
MYIKKQLLPTPGPTPFYSPALFATMASDLHHRTEAFRKVYRACLAESKEAVGRSNGVTMFAACGVEAVGTI